MDIEQDEAALAMIMRVLDDEVRGPDLKRREWMRLDAAMMHIKRRLLPPVVEHEDQVGDADDAVEVEIPDTGR